MTGLGYISSIAECTITGVSGTTGSNSSIAYGAGAIGSGTYDESPAVSGGGGSAYNPYAKSIIAPKGTLSDKATKVLNEALLKCKDQSITITSILRDKKDQARAMVDWINRLVNEKCSIDQAINIVASKYGAKGQEIVRSYNTKLSREANYNIFETKINETGFVSEHMRQSDRTTFDIGMSSVSNPDQLI